MIKATDQAVRVELKENPDRVKFSFPWQRRMTRRERGRTPVEQTVVTPPERKMTSYASPWFTAAELASFAYGSKIRPKLYHVIAVDRRRQMFESEADTKPDGVYYQVKSDLGQMMREFPNRWQADAWARYLNEQVTAD